MVKNIPDERIYGFVSSKYRFHFAKVTFAFFNSIGIGILSHVVIFVIKKLQDFIIKFELYHAAFIIDRACRSILNRLRHIVYINIVSEYFPRIPVPV